MVSAFFKCWESRWLGQLAKHKKANSSDQELFAKYIELPYG